KKRSPYIVHVRRFGCGDARITEVTRAGSRQEDVQDHLGITIQDDGAPVDKGALETFAQRREPSIQVGRKGSTSLVQAGGQLSLPRQLLLKARRQRPALGQPRRQGTRRLVANPFPNDAPIAADEDV